VSPVDFADFRGEEVAGKATALLIYPAGPPPYPRWRWLARRGWRRQWPLLLEVDHLDAPVGEATVTMDGTGIFQVLWRADGEVM